MVKLSFSQADEKHFLDNYEEREHLSDDFEYEPSVTTKRSDTNPRYSSSSVLLDAFEAYQLSSDDIENGADHASLLANQKSAGWSEYLPTDGIDEHSQAPYGPDDEESRDETTHSRHCLRHARRSEARLSDFFHNLVDSSRHAVSQANEQLRNTHKFSRRNTSDAAEQQWLPMKETRESSVPLHTVPLHEQLRGKTLMYFGPTHPLRVMLARLLFSWWFEPLILAIIVMQLVVLIISSSRNVVKHPLLDDWLSGPEAVVLLVVFSIYTMEMGARIIVSGLLIDPPPLTNAQGRRGSVASESSKEGLEHDEVPLHMQSNTRYVLGQWLMQLRRFLKREMYPYGPLAREYTDSHTSRFQPTEGVARGRQDVYGNVDHRIGAPFTVPYARSYAEERSPFFTVWRSFLTVCVRFTHSITGDPAEMTNRAYLRHSWQRVDIISIISYWIALSLQISHTQTMPNRHIYLFRALSVLRCARLMMVPDGTATILLSLKRVAPLLFRVAYFMLFFVLLFAIIGTQSFEGSYRRRCVWIGDLNNEPGMNYTLSQICGGSWDPRNSSAKMGHVEFDGGFTDNHPKGYICPYGQLCVEQAENPYNNVLSFDNVFTSLLEVFVVISLNGWSDIMYDMIDADYYSAVIYFIFGIMLLNFWLANLFVAVISHSFASLSAQTQHSAFAAITIHGEEEQVAAEQQQPPAQHARRQQWHKAQMYKRLWGWTKYLWLVAIILSLGIQGSQSSYQYPDTVLWRRRAERGLTIAFDVEIVLRFVAYALDGTAQEFFRRRHNLLDFFLAVITSIIQIPVVHRSGWYPWLTFFQLARFYRVIAAIPRMRLMLLRVVGSVSGLLNMIVFLLMMIFMAALFSIQLFRGDIRDVSVEGEQEEMVWKQLFNGFLGVYQIFSSENWTHVLLNVISSEKRFNQQVISGIFLVCWFIFANFIVLQMLIAVINENFRVAEGDKYKRQMERYLRRSEPVPQSRMVKFMQMWSPFRAQRALPQLAAQGEAEAPSHLMSVSAIAGASPEKDEDEPRSLFMQLVTPDRAGQAMDTLQRMLRLDKPHEHAHLKSIQARMLSGRGRNNNHPAMYDFEHVYYEEDEETRLLAGQQNIRNMREDLGLIDGDQDRQGFLENYANQPHNERIQLARTIAEYPMYDRSWFMFSSRNPIRRFCQTLTPCSHGERLFGRPMSRLRNYIFQTIIFGAIVGSVVAAGIATPKYRKHYYAEHGTIFKTWFSGVELSLSVIFVLEFFVKTIADGFIFTPNAYIYNIWNLLDMFVFIAILINVISEFVVVGGVSNFTRALKALRVLRLINLSSLMRDTFHAVMIAGAGRILDAAMLALLYIIPYAVWGQNLFAGLLYACNDDSPGILTKLDCHGEYSSQPLNWAFLAPRAWKNPTQGSMYSFDDFKSSLLILFEIVSLEGWINVMTAAMSIVGRDQQPQADHSQHNAIFFLIYNLIGAVSVLTLFVSVIIENFQRYSGAAYLTTEQRQWVDLKRQLLRQGASKRPKNIPTNAFAKWCYNAATKKKGWWLRSMTLMHLCILIILMTQSFDDSFWARRLRSGIFIICGLVYLLDIIVTLVGLGFSGFRRNLWNWYDVVVVCGVLGTTIPALVLPDSTKVYAQLQKIFLTGVALKLVQRNDALNQLFKTAIGSLPAIFSIFLLWLTMFFVWAIMLVEIFGLTKWGQNETHAKNLSSLWGTLVFLFMTSTGEGWNGYMHDYTVQPPICTPSSNYLESDCGSLAWAYFLFITWNIISMFIFLNMFTGTVVENFSYVYHLQGSTALSREQMRMIKDAWRKFDPQGHGYIQRDQIIAFLSQLTGMFDVRLYPADARIDAILKKTRVPERTSEPPSPVSSGWTRLGLHLPRSPRSLRRPRSRESDTTSSNLSPTRSTTRNDTLMPFSFEWPDANIASVHIESGVDLDKLESVLRSMDSEDLAMRRQRLNRMYHEALLSDKGKGISFTSMLFILAYNKMCTKPTNMEIAEFIDRRALIDRIDSIISLERVRGMLRTVYLRRRFLAARAGEEIYTRIAIPSDERGFPTITVEGDTMPARPKVTIDTRLDTLGSATPPMSRENLFDRDVADSEYDIHLTPLSASSSAARRRALRNANPFLSDDGSPRGSHHASSSSVQAHIPSPTREMSMWDNVIRRLSPEREPKDMPPSPHGTHDDP
ncbi:calcium channel protein [Malassezia vespertilionis]|uniref:calcium channel protein n=1 Tax=Malassezia vespertilionis TaxID=2020962 RepID=UPI0024B0CD8A|nr:calcium channel protein [Malassezia vespertilionis]WFD06570.1 calcium channel protein [Malassezia vespertilionis]